jgi:hypothetical protein
MKKILLTCLSLLALCAGTANALDTIEAYLKEYPNQQQVIMMNKWLETNKKGTFWFTGYVTPTDHTVITPQANVDYGYSWFSVSDGPAILKTPKYDNFFSVAIFDMRHNTPLIIRNPTKPILIIRPGQTAPKGDFTVVELETDQGLVFTRMLINDNLDEIKKLRKDIVLKDGTGDMTRNVQIFSARIEKQGHTILDALTPLVSPDDMFSHTTGESGFISLATGVHIGQLGTPVGTVRYNVMTKDSEGKFLSGKNNYVVTTPANMYKKGGYFSVTLYSKKTKLLMPNTKKVYDRTSDNAKMNKDGTYTISVNPKGDGINGLPTSGKDFYLVIRAYVPTDNVDLFQTKIEKQ